MDPAKTGTLLSHIADAVLTLLSSSGVESGVKDLISGNINAARADLASEVPTIVNAGVQVGENMGDAAMIGYGGPIGAMFVPEANALLNAVGGNLETAIAHLLVAKNITQPVTIKANQ